MIPPRQPDDPRMAPIWLRAEALAEGHHDRSIAAKVRSGEWHRLRRGAYTSGEAWRALDEVGRHGLLARAVERQSRTAVVVSHVSALPEYDAPIWNVPLDVVHLTRTDRRAGRKEAGVQQHVGVLLKGDAMAPFGLEVTSPTRAGLELTTIAGVEECLVVLDNLVHRGLTSEQQLRDRYATMVHWPNTLHTDLVLRLLDGRSESVGETRSRYLCWRQHLPTPIPQHEICDSNGRVIARVDLAWPELGVYLEFDGKVKYTRLLKSGDDITQVVLAEKRREERIYELTGWRCIRLIWADLEQPERTAARIRAMLSRDGRVAE
jgi:hypothetical protein